MNKKLKVYVGKNGSGKTYQLKKILDSKNKISMYISEEGISSVSNQKNNVKINADITLYEYIDERKRGRQSLTDQYEIEEKSKNIIIYCRAQLKKLEMIKHKSHGQEKLKNMLSVFKQYNLNNIEKILFDEPESFLDENNIRVYAKLVKKLIESGYAVRIATHSSSLLKVLDIDITQLIVLNNTIDGRSENTINEKGIKKCFRIIRNRLEKKKNEKKFSPQKVMDSKIDIYKKDNLLKAFMNIELRRQDFYKCLFFDKILIVEGISELQSLGCIKEIIDSNLYIFSSNGKALIGVYALILQRLGKKISIMIDSDKKEEDDYNYNIALTMVLEKLNNINCIVNNPDLEGEYCINRDEILNELNLKRKHKNQGFVKQISAYFHFENQTNLNILLKKLEEDKSGQKYEFS